MSKLYKEEEVVQAIVDILEQAEENTGEIIVDRPMGWASIRDYAEEVVDLMPTAPGNVVAQIVIDTDELIEKIKEEYNIIDAWIPCSERLPNEDERIRAYVRHVHASEFLVMIEGADMPTVLYLTWDNYWKDDSWTDYRVIAWMPLPEPYEEEKINE